MTSPQLQSLNISIPPGSLGVGINKINGYCTVSSKTNQHSLLEVNDIITSLNGIKLVECEGGVTAWVTLFGAFSSSLRNLVVQRCVNNGATAAASATTAQPQLAPQLPAPSANVPTTAVGSSSNNGSSEPPVASSMTTHQPTINDSKKSETIVEPMAMVIDDTTKKLAATNGPPQLKLKTCDTCHVNKWHGIGTTTTCASCRGDVVPSSAANQKKVAAKGSTTSAADKKKKHALHDSTKHNATKKQKVSVDTKKQEPKTKKTTTNKKSSASNKKSSASNKKSSDWNHDDDYMKLVKDGFPNFGCVSPCGNYYISQLNDSYRSIADKIGLDGN